MTLVTAHPLDRRLAAVLPENALYAVGGRVRDGFRALLDPSLPQPKDLDYVVTGLTLDAVVDRLQTVGRVNVVGASFAVVKLSAPEGDADLALPRREHSTGIRPSRLRRRERPADHDRGGPRPARFPHEHDRPPNLRRCDRRPARRRAGHPGAANRHRFAAHVRRGSASPAAGGPVCRALRLRA